VTVPDVAGMPRADALAALAAAGLAAGEVTEESSKTVPKDHVISQDPAAGASVAPGTPVRLVVSSGKPKGRFIFSCGDGAAKAGRGDLAVLALAVAALAAARRRAARG